MGLIICFVVFIIVVIGGMFSGWPMGSHEIDCDIDPNETDKGEN